MNENFIYNQVYAFVVSVIVGVAWLSIYDVLKIIRHMTKCNYIVTSVCDIIFWLIGAALMVYTALLFNGGFIRSYLFAGVFVGVTVYLLTIGKILKCVVGLICKKGNILKNKFKIKTSNNV